MLEIIKEYEIEEVNVQISKKENDYTNYIVKIKYTALMEWNNEKMKTNPYNIKITIPSVSQIGHALQKEDEEIIKEFFTNKMDQEVDRVTKENELRSLIRASL